MNELTERKQNGEVAEINFTQEQVELIKRTIAKDATDDELKLFLWQAQRSGLDPFAKQINCIKRGGKMSIETSIDGYRAIADRTGLYAGNDDYTFNDGLTEYQHIQQAANGEPPVTATARVWKIVHGQHVAFSATARWEEYFPGDKVGFQWKRMPYLMLGKCAEALALRKAFPLQLGGMHTEDEMAQAQTAPAKDVTPKPQEQTKQRNPDEIKPHPECKKISEAKKRDIVERKLVHRESSIEDACLWASKGKKRLLKELSEDQLNVLFTVSYGWQLPPEREPGVEDPGEELANELPEI